MYEYSKRPSKLKNFFLIFLLMVVVSAASIFIYSMYTKINIEDYTKTPEATATRLYSDAENVKEQAEFSNVLEEVTKGVVGISNKASPANTFFLSINRLPS